MSEIVFGIKLKADGSNLNQVVESNIAAIKKLSSASQEAGRSSDSMNGREKALLSSLKEKVIAAERGEFALMRYQAAQVGAAKSAEPLIAKLEQIKNSSAGSATNTDALGASIGRIARLGGALITLDKLKDVSVDSFKAGVELNKFTNTLKFSSGSAEAASQEIEYLSEVSNRLGIDLTTASKGYIRLAAASVGTQLEGQKTKDIFEAISSASIVMGLSAEETQGAIFAIGQMMSKGRVASEELRGQLGERLPGAFQVAARAMGVTTAELGKMLEMGEVISDDFLPKFAEEMKRTLGGTVVEAADSAQAQINELSASWTQFKRNASEAGVLEIGLSVIERTDNALKWFNHFVFGKGELADMQRRQNNPGRIDALRSEQEFLQAGGNNLDPSNTLERRRERLTKIAAEIRKLEKEIGITRNVNALPGAAAIGSDQVMPLLASSQIGAGSGKDEGGGYGPDINKRNQELQRSAEKAIQISNQQAQAFSNVSREIGTYTTSLSLGDQANQQLTRGQELANSIMERLASGSLKLADADRQRLSVMLETMLGEEQQTLLRQKAIEQQEEMNRLLAESDDRAAELENERMEADQAAADAREKSFSDFAERMKAENEDLNVSLISSDTARAKAQLDLEHERAKERIYALMLEGEQVDELINQETENYEKRLQLLNREKTMAKDLGLTFKSAFEDAIVGGEKFSEVLTALGDDIERLLVRRTITEPLMSGFDSILSNFDFGSFFPTNHTGGIVGLEATSMRRLSSAVFSGAPRYHTGGIAGDEVPSILKRGEGVFTQEQMRNLAPAGAAPRVTVNLIESPGSGGQVNQRDEQDGSLTLDVMVEKIESMMGRNIQRGGGIAPSLERQYGLNRAVGGR